MARGFSLAGAVVAMLAAGVVAAASQTDQTPRLPLSRGTLLMAGDRDVADHGGDFNGDGRSDALIGTDLDVYVVYGSSRPHRVAPQSLGASGFAITGRGDWAGLSWAINSEVVGDMNGDGRADVAVGAPYSSPGDRWFAGQTIVVYGQPGGGSLNVRKPLGDRGFRIIGARGGTSNDTNTGGSSLGGDHPPRRVGDVNGDGLQDVLVGDSSAEWLVFGARSSGDVDLADPHGRAIKITPQTNNAFGAGDVNGDGLADLGFGYTGADLNRGEADIVFGSRNPMDVDTARPLGALGFKIRGAAPDRPDTRCDDLEMPCDVTPGDNGTQVGAAVAAAGDVNHDGIGDVVIGATGANAHGVDSGAAYVVFGSRKPRSVRVDRLGRGGLMIGGGFAEENFGGRIFFNDEKFLTTGAGDVDGDGRSDLLFLTSSFEELPAQRAYVVLSRAGAPTRFVSRLGRDGFRFVPTAGRADRTSWVGAASALGDFDGDARADLAISGHARKGAKAGVYLFRFPRTR